MCRLVAGRRSIGMISREFFHVLDGEIEVTFREETAVLKTGQTANIPANAPHRFVNAADRPARLLRMRSGRAGGIFPRGRR